MAAVAMMTLSVQNGAAQSAKVFTTSPDRSQSLTEETITPYGSSTAADAIILKPSGTNQEIDGFGYAITYAACYNLMRMEEGQRKALLEQTYSPTKGYGVSYARIAIGGHDFSSDEYTYCDEKGPDNDLLSNFSFTADETAFVIPILQEILAINPSLKIIATPWTPPRWMKYGDNIPGTPYNSWTGGRLEPKYFYTYGQYFVKFIQEMGRYGIPIHAVSPQNEPLNWGNSSSLWMPWEDEAGFIRDGLAPALHDAGLEVKIYIYDHNYNYDNNKENNGNYVTKVYDRILNSDFRGKELIAGSCWHNYGGKVEDIKDDVIWGDWQHMDVLFTEASIGDWNNADDLSVSLARDMDELVIAPSLHRFRGSLGWNFMLDSNNEPHRGAGACTNCHGALDLILTSDGQPTGGLRPTSQYFAMAHTSAVVKPGARRIDTDGWWTDNLSYAAYLNPDNTTAILLANTGNRDLNVKVNSNGNTYMLTVPAHGVTSARMDILPSNQSGVETVATGSFGDIPVVLHDLQGRQVTTPGKGGIYVTSDGKKIRY